MFSLIDLGLLLVVAFSFVILFMIRQKFFSSHYFSLTEVAIGVDVTLSYWAIILKLIVVYLFGLVTMLIFNDVKIVIYGATFGAFLIIWPNIINPYFFISVNRNQLVFVYILYMIFICITFLFTYLGAVTVINYKQELIKAIFDDLLQNIIWLVIGGFLVGSWKKTSERLSNIHVIRSGARDDDQ